MSSLIGPSRIPSTVLGKRPASADRAERPASYQPRVPSTAHGLAAAASNPFEWKRNGKTIVSDIALFKAMNSETGAGAGAELYSARLGRHWVQDAPAAFFASATAAGVDPRVDDSAVKFTLNGHAVQCTRKEAILLTSAPKGEGSNGPLAIEVGDARIEASLELLQWLLRPQKRPVAAEFQGTVNGRSLRYSFTLLERLIAADSAIQPAGGGYASVELDGNTLQIPESMLRELLLVRQSTAARVHSGQAV